MTSGWVGLEREGRDAFVPEGAVCALRNDAGPGTRATKTRPRATAKRSRSSISAAWTIRAVAPRSSWCFDSAVRDAMTLWHLLTRGTPEERARVYDRLAALAPPPEGVTREQILAGNRCRTAGGISWASTSGRGGGCSRTVTTGCLAYRAGPLQCRAQKGNRLAGPAPESPYSTAVKADGLIYLSGTLAEDAADAGGRDVGTETRLTSSACARCCWPRAPRSITSSR